MRIQTFILSYDEYYYFFFQLLSHVQLVRDPVDYSPPGFSIHGISQASIYTATDILKSISQHLSIAS